MVSVLCLDTIVGAEMAEAVVVVSAAVVDRLQTAAAESILVADQVHVRVLLRVQKGVSGVKDAVTVAA